MADTTWTSPRRLYLDKAGKVVEENDPTRASLLVAAGGSIPLARAQELGLLDEAKAAPAPAETKLRPGPAENKALSPETEAPEQPVDESSVTFDPAPAFEQAVEDERGAGVRAEETPKRRRGQ